MLHFSRQCSTSQPLYNTASPSSKKTSSPPIKIGQLPFLLSDNFTVKLYSQAGLSICLAISFPVTYNLAYVYVGYKVFPVTSSTLLCINLRKLSKVKSPLRGPKQPGTISSPFLAI